MAEEKGDPDSESLLLSPKGAQVAFRKDDVCELGNLEIDLLLVALR